MYIRKGVYVPHESHRIDLSVTTEVVIQVPIRSFKQVVLPYLTNHEYAKPEHFAPRISGKPGYLYSNEVVQYYDVENQIEMVEVRLKGQSAFNRMTLEFFDKYVKNQIAY